VAAALRGSGMSWGGGSPVGATAWVVGGGGPIGGGGQSRLGGDLVGRRPEGCGSP
jgi:hypothetical protein